MATTAAPSTRADACNRPPREGGSGSQPDGERDRQDQDSAYTKHRSDNFAIAMQRDCACLYCGKEQLQIRVAIEHHAVRRAIDIDVDKGPAALPTDHAAFCAREEPVDAGSG
ncbi:hypothetical protein FJ967_04790 [Mesorhizobium sp. B2-3-4]|nr:hypothetical protein FJ967_04790 [Mesorhizobium sp. B2-3-4]